MLTGAPIRAVADRCRRPCHRERSEEPHTSPGPSIVGFGDFEYVNSTRKPQQWFQCGFSAEAGVDPLSDGRLSKGPGEREKARQIQDRRLVFVHPIARRCAHADAARTDRAVAGPPESGAHRLFEVIRARQARDQVGPISLKACVQRCSRNPGMHQSWQSGSMARAAAAVPMSAGCHPNFTSRSATTRFAPASLPQ